MKPDQTYRTWDADTVLLKDTFTHSAVMMPENKQYIQHDHFYASERRWRQHKYGTRQTAVDNLYNVLSSKLDKSNRCSSHFILHSNV